MNYFDDLNDMSCEYPSYRPFTSAALASSTEKIAAIADTADISDADYCSDDTGYTWLCRIEDRFCDAHRHLPLFNEAQRRSRDYYADALHKTAESAKLLLLYSKLTKTEAETITRVAPDACCGWLPTGASNTVNSLTARCAHANIPQANPKRETPPVRPRALRYCNQRMESKGLSTMTRVTESIPADKRPFFEIFKKQESEIADFFAGRRSARRMPHSLFRFLQSLVRGDAHCQDQNP